MKPASLSALLLASLLASPLGAPIGAQPRRSVPLTDPVVLIGDVATVVAGSASALAAASDTAALARALAACRITSVPEAALRRRLVPGTFADGDVVFIVVPRASAAPNCEAAAVENPALLARGIRMSRDATHDPRTDLRAATVRIGGGPVRADAVQRWPTLVVTALAAATLDTLAPATLVVTVPGEAFVPDATGALPDVVVEIAPADGAAPAERLTMYAYNVSRAWHQVLPVRLARLGDAAAPAHAALALLHRGGLTREDERAARLTIADALLAGGDSSAARIVLHDVLHDAPCLTLASASPGYARMLDDLRPRGVRCTVTPIGRVALASLVPGLGHAVTGRRRTAWQVGGGTLLLGAISLGLRMAGDARYDDYLVATDAEAAEDGYNNAAGLRTASSGVAGAAALAWLLGGIDAVRAERAHRAELARQRDPGARVTVRVTPDASRGTLHTGVAVTW